MGRLAAHRGESLERAVDLFVLIKEGTADVARLRAKKRSKALLFLGEVLQL